MEKSIDKSMSVESYINAAQRKGEIFASYIRIGLVGFLLLLGVVITLLDSWTTKEGMYTAFISLIFIGIVSAIALWICKTKEKFKWLGWITSGLEISLVTAVLLSLMAPTNNPEVIMITLIHHLYYLFFGLALIRRRAIIVLYIGILTAVQYTFLVFYAYSMGLFNTFEIVQGPGIHLKEITFDMSDALGTGMVLVLVGVVLYIYQSRNEKVFKDEVLGRNKIASLQDSFREQMETAAKSLVGSNQNLSSSIEQARNNLTNLNNTMEMINSSSNQQLSAVKATSSNLQQLMGSIDNINKSIVDEVALVEQSSASISQMAASIQSITGISNNAVEIANRSHDEAKRGQKSVDTTIDAIKEIEESSTQIADFVQIISGISEQTNLLAMNAAIEAAHAGDAGKGFSVVADEIRKLAENSSENALEITGVIKNITKMIENTVQLSLKSGEGLTRILGDIDNTTIINQEIAGAMVEQRNAANEIIKSMEKLLSISNDIREFVKNQVSISQYMDSAFNEQARVATQIVENTKEHSKNTQELNHTIENLREILENNKNLIDQFTLIIENYEKKEEETQTEVEDQQSTPMSLILKGG